MKSLHYILFVSLLSVAAISTVAQTPTTASAENSAGIRKTAARRGPVFKANKDQVVAAQTMLKTKGIYAGEATGKLDDATRDSIKDYQKDNGLRATGTLNRATLEKMRIGLTDKQKAIPVSERSYASADKDSGGSRSGTRRNVFRATKEQITEAQKLLKAGGMYAGEETGKLDDPTREGLKKYQESKGLKPTGTLNQVTLEKMGIALSDKQKPAEGN